jgi:hypothetical protein
MKLMASSVAPPTRASLPTRPSPPPPNTPELVNCM